MQSVFEIQHVEWWAVEAATKPINPFYHEPGSVAIRHELVASTGPVLVGEDDAAETGEAHHSSEEDCRNFRKAVEAPDEV